METITHRKGRCRFCCAPTTTDQEADNAMRRMSTYYRAACEDCQAMTCKSCCYVHHRCPSHKQ